MFLIHSPNFYGAHNIARHSAGFAGFGVTVVNQGDMVSVALIGLISHSESQEIKHPVS